MSINYLRNSFRCIFRVAAFLLALSLFLSASAYTAEYFPDGGFEIGNVYLEISRSPRYGGPLVAPSAMDQNSRIDGANSLRLPGGKGVEYRLMTRAVWLEGGKRYTVSLKLLTQGSCAANLEAFTMRKVVTTIEKTSRRLAEGLNTVSLSFSSDPEGGIHWLRILLKTQKTVWLDSLSLQGPAGPGGAPVGKDIWLEPDEPMGVYRVGAKGVMTARVDSGPGSVTYRITAQPSGREVAKAEALLDKTRSVEVPLDTSKPGYYLVEASHGPGKSVSRAYAVITPAAAGVPADPRFGLCMEEHTATTAILDALKPDDIYGLARDMGAGSARFFSLTFPDHLSEDGRTYDYKELDAALALAEKYGLEVMIPLGCNQPSNIPSWMRTPSEQGTVDLKGGARTAKQQTMVERAGGERYLNMKAYGRYLDALMKHIKGRVKYLEIWNEPGHKYAARDVIKLAETTKKVRDNIYPSARLLGYCSTKGRGIGQGMDLGKDPEFLKEVAELGGLNFVDMLSYHSGHAFPFMGKEFDPRNQDTGYVKRIRRIEARAGKAGMTVWDTERGFSWFSGAMDEDGEVMDNDVDIGNAVSMFDAARQLPVVYAVGFADGVELINWFVFDTSVSQVYKNDLRWGVFDVNGEPSAMIPAYDAMTDMLSGAAFHSILDKPDGTRAYVFGRGSGTVILTYNWLEKESGLAIKGGSGQAVVHDIFGNPLSAYEPGAELKVNGWPVYIVFNGTVPQGLEMN